MHRRSSSDPQVKGENRFTFQSKPATSRGGTVVRSETLGGDAVTTFSIRVVSTGGQAEGDVRPQGDDLLHGPPPRLPGGAGNGNLKEQHLRAPKESALRRAFNPVHEQFEGFLPPGTIVRGGTSGNGTGGLLRAFDRTGRATSGGRRHRLVCGLPEAPAVPRRADGVRRGACCPIRPISVRLRRFLLVQSPSGVYPFRCGAARARPGGSTEPEFTEQNHPRASSGVYEDAGVGTAMAPRRRVSATGRPGNQEAFLVP